MINYNSFGEEFCDILEKNAGVGPTLRALSKMRGPGVTTAGAARSALMRARQTRALTKHTQGIGQRLRRVAEARQVRSASPMAGRPVRV